MYQSMMRVLIFPAGTEIGKEIYHSLRHQKNIELVLAGADYDNPARHSGCGYHILPDVSADGWLTALQQLLRDEEIDAIFPAHDDALLALAQNRSLLSATVLCPSQETCTITRYKSQTYAALEHVIPVPRVFQDASDITQWPVFVKPDRGQGAQGAVRIETPAALRAIQAQRQDLIVCEYLDGEEFTVDCFSDRQQGLLFCQPRTRIRAGIAMTSTLVDLPEVKAYAQAISAHLQLYGAWFFQLKRSATGVLTLLEVAPRIAGTMCLNRINGINFAMLTLYESMRVNIAMHPVCQALQVTRSLTNHYKHDIRFQHLYIDYDDTVVIKGRLCLLVITFLYKCFNEGKKIHLVTRHAGDIARELKHRRISDLFDSVSHLNQDDRKSSVIKHQDAIFVDDSFSERAEVYHVKQIPVFDISMLELFMGE
jgi:carbamoyl-phosphate synthase large subunit